MVEARNEIDAGSKKFLPLFVAGGGLGVKLTAEQSRAEQKLTTSPRCPRLRRMERRVLPLPEGMRRSAHP